MLIKQIDFQFAVLSAFAFFARINGDPVDAVDLTSLKMKLLKNYDSSIIPITNNEPVNVTVSVNINDMVPMETTAMHFTIDCHFGLKWIDYRLKFNLTNTTSVLFDHHFFESIWVPDMYFTKSKKGYRHAIPVHTTLVTLQSDGTVLTEQRISVSSFCPMDLLFYPFDIQECQLHIESYAYNSEYIRLLWRSERNANTEKNKNLHIAGFSQVDIKLSSGSVLYGKYGIYSRLTMNFKLYRDLALFLLRDFFPCIMIVMLSWISFWISHRSTPARVGLGITTVLTVVTMTNNVKQNAPSTGLFRSLDYYLLLCNLFVFAALLEYAVVERFPPPLNRTKKKKKKKGVSNGNTNEHNKNVKIDLQNHGVQLRSIQYINGALSPDTKLNRNVTNLEMQKTTESNETSTKPKPHPIDRLSRKIFPLAFSVMNIIYFTFHRLHPDTVD